MSREIYCRARIDPKEIHATAELGQTVIQYVGEANPYTGEYVVTPSENEQVLATKGKYLSNNVVINPIPSNYGKISWNGSVLTVS